MQDQDIVVVFGPAGSGKNSLIALVLAELPGYVLARSATTRAPRPSDYPPGGGDSKYVYVTTDEFQRLIDGDKLLEHNPAYAGCSYGTLRPPEGQNVILEINIDGARQVRERHLGARLVFVAVPGGTPGDQLNVLRGRMEARAAAANSAVDPSDMAKRLCHARAELAQGPDLADLVIVNDDLGDASHRLLNFIRS